MLAFWIHSASDTTWQEEVYWWCYFFQSSSREEDNINNDNRVLSCNSPAAFQEDRISNRVIWLRSSFFLLQTFACGDHVKLSQIEATLLCQQVSTAMKISDPNPSPPPPDTYNIAQIVCYTQNANEHYQKQDHRCPCFSCLVAVITKHKWHFHKFTSVFLGTKILHTKSYSSRISFVLPFCKYCAHREHQQQQQQIDTSENDILLQCSCKSDFHKCLINFCRSFLKKILWILGSHVCFLVSERSTKTISRLWAFAYSSVSMCR